MEIRRKQDPSVATNGADHDGATHATETKTDAKPHVLPDWVPAPVAHLADAAAAARRTTIESAKETLKDAIRTVVGKAADGMKLTPEERARLGADLKTLADQLTKLDADLEHIPKSHPFYAALAELVEGAHKIHEGVECFWETNHPAGSAQLGAGVVQVWMATQDMLREAKSSGQLEPAKDWEPLLRDLGDAYATCQKIGADLTDIEIKKPHVRLAG